MNNNLLAALQAKKAAATEKPDLASVLAKRSASTSPLKPPNDSPATIKKPHRTEKSAVFQYEASIDSFLFFSESQSHNDFKVELLADKQQVQIPLAPCVYRLCDVTLAKKEPITLRQCTLQLNVLRCLQRECGLLNGKIERNSQADSVWEESELRQMRFMELLSNCGVYQRVLDLLLENPKASINVDGLDDFLAKIESLQPQLLEARGAETISFFPGIGELYTPGTKLLCHPDGLDGTPVGCTCVQGWYAEENNNKKLRYVLVVEFTVSCGDAVVVVAASEVIPEFPADRPTAVRDLQFRPIGEDKILMARLQKRGELYTSIATGHHFLEYQNDSLYPILSGWNSRSVQALSKGGRIMVDVQRGLQAGHVPVRATNDGMGDTVKEAIKLWDQSKRTGVVVPFRRAVPEIDGWMCWPMVTGFSFTARVWGKLLIGLSTDPHLCSNTCGHINFQQTAFDQLVLAEDKKELIRAVARNTGNLDDEEETVGLDVVANKGGASIFLLHGPPGCGKTLTAEAIAELLQKPLYVVTAGDLGITAAEVEKTFGTVLDLCQTWDALVLMDEADIFLETRSSTEIQRNALVCVMLRLLEYYSGCLFLSSNRGAESIDPAIASRITVMLGYPPLDTVGRAKVWQNLIELVPVISDDVEEKKKSKYRMEFGSEDYQTLGEKYALNGRQIKNSIVLARALARERSASLSMALLHRAVTAVAGQKHS